MRGISRFRMAALALAAAVATLPGLASAGGQDSGNPQEQARIEEWIQQVITGNIEADRQEQARIDRLVRQAIRGDATAPAPQPRPALRPAEAGQQPGRVPLAGIGLSGR